jgi:xylan 1,4-beta-xylosidase
LRLRGGHSPQSVFGQSLVARRLVDVRCTVRTAVEFGPRDFTHMAGLICYYDTRGFYYLRVTHDSDKGRVLGVVANDGGIEEEVADVELPSQQELPRVHLRADIDGGSLQFYHSPDGLDWRRIGPELDMSTLSDDYGDRLRFTGAVVGICAQDLSGNTATADFGNFTVQPQTGADGPLTCCDDL